MRASLRLALASLSVAVLLGGCTFLGGDDDSGLSGGDGADGGGGGGDDSGGADDGGGDGGGADDGDGAGVDPLSGVYRVESSMDLTSTPLANDLVPSTVATLNELASRPAGTLIDLLEAADVPILDQLLGLLGDLLLEPFAGFVDEFVVERVVDGLPLRDQLLVLANDVVVLVTQFELLSQLELSGLDEGGGAISATHQLAGISLPFRNQDIVVDTPELIDQITVADGVSCAVSLGSTEGSIQVGAHQFGLPLGGLALDALQQVIGLRDTLGALFDCPALAEEVSSRCLTPLLCIGNREQIEEFCEAGLDQAVAQIESRISSALNVVQIRFEGGNALLRDTEGEGTIDQLAQGNWDVAVTVDGIDVPFFAAFDGLRVEPANP
jgi:hypothetical protein